MLLKIKNSKNRIAENIKRGKPDTILSIIYTEISHKSKREAKVKSFIARSARSGEKKRDRAQRSILPPSSESTGRRLKRERVSDMAERLKK